MKIAVKKVKKKKNPLRGCSAVCPDPPRGRFEQGDREARSRRLSSRHQRRRRAPQRYSLAAIPPAPESKRAAKEATEAQEAEAEAESTGAEAEEEEEDDESITP